MSAAVSGADPGSLVEGRRPVGGVYLRRGQFLVETYAKTKELGPVGGGREGVHWRHPLGPPMGSQLQHNFLAGSSPNLCVTHHLEVNGNSSTYRRLTQGWHILSCPTFSFQIGSLCQLRNCYPLCSSGS